MPDDPGQPPVPPRPAPPPVSAHFVNNVLAAAASYIEEDPDLARDVLAELGQFLSYRLREDPGEVSAAQELAHTATYLRLQQARFPDRIETRLPEAHELSGRVTPGAIQGPLAEALGARLRERPGTCRVTLRPAPGGLALELLDADGSAQHHKIALPEGAPA
jgi:two-component system LytT family sensor kinase